MNEQPVRFDVEGYEYVTAALMDMANDFPGLEEGETIQFATEPTGDGIAIFPATGSFIYEERESITGHVTQLCQYPFNLLYRASGLNPSRRMNAKEWLDAFSRWIEKQPITIGETTYVLEDWPVLADDREIREVTRQTPAYLVNVDEDKSENWIVEIVIRYRNEFDR